MTSGAAPKCSHEPPRWKRKPARTSSMAKMAPWASQSARTPGKKPGAGSVPVVWSNGAVMTTAI